jgi:hypothetical protein
MAKSSTQKPQDASTWAQLCERKRAEYQVFLEAFPDRPDYAEVKRPSGQPRDFLVWRELYFGRCDPQLEALFRKRCLEDIEIMFAQEIFERCRPNYASMFPADRGHARSIRSWLRLFGEASVELEDLQLSAEDHFESVSKDPVGMYDEISEFRTVRTALLYFIVGDHARAEMMMARLSGRKAFHQKLLVWTRGVLRQQPSAERELEQQLQDMLAVHYHRDLKESGFLEADVNFLLLSAWACFKEGMTINKTAAKVVGLTAKLIR